jgi:hypothetical protein
MGGSLFASVVARLQARARLRPELRCLGLPVLWLESESVMRARVVAHVMRMARLNAQALARLPC